MDYQGFKQFVSEQPADKRIDHCTWRTCAIGEYAKSCGDITNITEGWPRRNLPEKIYEALNDGPTPRTYGDLAIKMEKV